MLSVLLVDDEKMLVDVTSRFLERYGEMTVTPASTATDALALLSERSFDAIVADYDLPGINGIEFLKIIRAKGNTTPVIIFTGVGREHAAIDALNSGADFFIQKGDDPNTQLRSMVDMIKKAVDRRSAGTSLGTADKLLSDVVNFFPFPAFIVNNEARVIAWNQSMADLSLLPSKEMIGKGSVEYSLPFFGRRSPMLVDLVFKDDEEIWKSNYALVSRDQSAVVAWTKGLSKEGQPAILWMKASALFDTKGVFVGTIGLVRDVTEEMGPELLKQPIRKPAPATQPEIRAAPVGRFDKIMGKAKTLHRDGLVLMRQGNKFEEAIRLFDQAIEIDPSIAFVWNDRGVCFRELGNFDEAVLSLDKASELDSNNEEILFTRAELFKQIGVLKQRKNAIESAIRLLNRVLELNPSCAEAWNSLGICTKELGKADLSRQYFDKARGLIRDGKNINVRKRE